jgi:hypothetical protein
VHRDSWWKYGISSNQWVRRSLNQEIWTWIIDRVRKFQDYLRGSGLLGSEKHWLWEFTCYRSEMLKHSSEKLNSIPQKKRNKRQCRRSSKFSGYHSSFPSRNEFLIKVLSQYRCRWEFFRAKLSMEMKAVKVCFDVYFAYFSVWNFICQICGLIKQAKRS